MTGAYAGASGSCGTGKQWAPASHGRARTELTRDIIRSLLYLLVRTNYIRAVYQVGPTTDCPTAEHGGIPLYSYRTVGCNCMHFTQRSYKLESFKIP